MRLIILLFSFISINTSTTVWGPNGHRIVAQICIDNLSATAKESIEDALGANYMTQVATWPDFIKSEKNWGFTQSWHYMTVDTDKTVEEVMQESAKDESIDNVIEAIELMIAVLNKNKEATNKFEELMSKNQVEPLSGSTEATAIAFLIHFIGDIHQPMHVGKGNDRGGNRIDVMFFSKESNLHSVWDSGIIEKEQLSFTEFSSFVDKHWGHEKTRFQEASINTWAKESITIRDTIYNSLCEPMGNVPCLPDFSYQYQHDFSPTIEKRLGAAGFRSARVFNTIYKEK